MANCITIYTDASVCMQTHVGGWACWIKHGKGEKMQAASAFKGSVVDSTEAELKAIANALHVMVRSLNPKNAIIVVTTDSSLAIECISGKTFNKENKPKFKEKFASYRKLASSIKKLIPAGCELRMRKVKAHNKTDGRRSYVNNVVDKMARQEMKKARAA